MTPPTDALDAFDAPTPEVLDAVDRAWERAAAFAAAGLDLHVSVGRVRGQVRGRLLLEDRVLLRLSPAQVLALACGDPAPMPRPA